MTTSDGPVRRPSRATRYLVGQSVSMIGDGTVAVTFAFAALIVTRSGWAMPAVLLGLWLARTAFINVGGRWGDSKNRAAVMVWSDVVRLASQAFPAICFLVGRPALWQLVLSAVVYGAATAFFVPSSRAIIPQLVAEDRIQKVNSVLGVVRNVALLTGPAIAAVLYRVGGVPLALAFDVATFAVSVATLATIVRGLPRPAAAPQDDDDDDVSLLGSFGVLARYPTICWIVVVWCAVQLGVASLNILGPLVARDRLGGVETWSILVTAMAIGGLAGSAAAGWIKPRRPSLVVMILLGTFMPVQLVLLAWPTLWALALVIVLTSAVLAVCGVLFDTYLQTSLPETVLGRVSSAEYGLTGAMIPIGFVISLPLATLLGTRTYLTGLAAVIVVLAVIAFAVTRGARGPAQPKPAAAAAETPVG